MIKKVLIATDSFKGTLTSSEAGVAVCEGIKEVFPDAEVIIREAADGGEGTSGIVTRACKGRTETITASGPVEGMKVQAHYGIINGSTAVIDISEACGITLVPEDLRNPLYTTTRGIGDMILDALDKGCRNFIIGLGGSSTNDCGTGMLSALGIEFTDKEGSLIRPGASGLSSVGHISLNGLDRRIKESEFVIACDVKNPLTGPSGCSMIFAPQKGADPETCKLMDNWINDFTAIVSQTVQSQDPLFPGCGAAGGLGYAFRTFLNGSLVSGAGLITEITHLKEAMEGADLVITGEGKIDSQTPMGKIPSQIARLASSMGIPVIAFAGIVEADKETLHECGIDEVYSISEGISIDQAMTNAASLLTIKVKEVMRGRAV